MNSWSIWPPILVTYQPHSLVFVSRFLGQLHFAPKLQTVFPSGCPVIVDPAPQVNLHTVWFRPFLEHVFDRDDEVSSDSQVMHSEIGLFQKNPLLLVFLQRTRRAPAGM